MKGNLIRWPSMFLWPPMLASCGITYWIYELPSGYLAGLWILGFAASLTLLMDALLGTRLPSVQQFRLQRYAGTRESFLVMALAAGVAVFCLLDVALFPIPLFSDPSSYATLSPLRAHVRHISNMCWILPPIALLCVRHAGCASRWYWLGSYFRSW